MAAGLWVLAGCDGESGKALFSGKIYFVSPSGYDSIHRPESIASDKATVEVLPLMTDHTDLDHLSDLGRASGFQYLFTANDALPTPVSVAPGDATIALPSNFFGDDSYNWTRLRSASSNKQGLIAGYGVVNQLYLVWTWDGHPVTRYLLPAGVSIEQVIGPADDGSFAANTYNDSTVTQNILHWKTDGSVSSIYSITPIKAGMTLIGMASNGLIGGIERVGYLLMPKIYDGQWKALGFDYNQCFCEAKRINAQGQMLMSPRFDLDLDARGYLVGSGSATVLPRLGIQTTYADLNNTGDIVGTSGNTAVIIIGGMLHDLNTYVGSASLGWHFDTAVAINNKKQIVGLGTWQGQQRWYLLTLK